LKTLGFQTFRSGDPAAEPRGIRGIEYASCGRGEDIALYTLTSGTTGTPKAVAISHRAWTYAVKKQVKIFKYKTHERVAIQSRFACDGIFDALCAFSVTGTAVLIVSDLFYDTKAWVNTIEQKKISCLPIISSIVHLIATDKEDASMPSCVEKIIFAGDFIHPTVVQFLKEYCTPSVAIYNLYGSSEDFYILSKRVNLDQPDQAGCFELPNEQERSTQIKLTCIKNSDTNLLSIKSQSLFSGYLTNHKTLDLPLDLSGYFCTGDLFKKHNNGLALAGRFDRQIKWCGYRIEPEEIERALCENEGITEACLYAGDIPEQEEALICAIVSDLPEDSLEKIVRHTVATKVYTEYKDDVIIHKVKTLPRKKKIR
jgi:D-alanine--poly(phosphoribitol) ligase subunit 1